MKEIISYSYPRAAVIGNPSDGFYGKTIAFVFDNYRAEVTLSPIPSGIHIQPATIDKVSYSSPKQMVDHLNQYGYYGGIRLIKATVKKFYEKFDHVDLHKQGFELRYQSNIPVRVGMAGSSAIITATMKALMSYYDVSLDKPLLANLILSVETEELGIPAGLQDRVAQVYECPVFMSFDRELMQNQGYGEYRKMNKSDFSKFYIAYAQSSAEGSEVVHNNLRQRFDKQEIQVVSAMEELAELTQEVYGLVSRKMIADIGEKMNRNFDIRARICRIAVSQKRMIELARSCGASAKFTGSGGAIIGRYKDDYMFDNLVELMKKHNIIVIKPNIVEHVNT